MSPVVLPNLGIAGALVYEWVDPGDIVRSLSGNATVNVMVGERGLGLPGIDLVTDKLPYYAGEQVRHGAIPAREIELPMHFEAASAAALEQLMDGVYGWFATADEQSRTPGYLRLTRQDGTQRQLACYYAGGLEGDLSWPRAGDRWQDAVVRLKAADPWATDVSDTVITYVPADLPNVTVINPGQIDAYPIWFIHGPCNGPITVTNTTTGRAWAFSFALSSTLGVILDTRPANQRTNDIARRFPDDLNVFNYLTPTSDRWTLQPGSNTITIPLTGTSGLTTVELTYRARYRGLRR